MRLFSPRTISRRLSRGAAERLGARTLHLAGYAASKGLRGTALTLEVLADLTPVVRMAAPAALPANMTAGFIGAEVATWSAVSPSLVPRPWWATAANVAICQGLGHLVGATAYWTTMRAMGRHVDRDRRGGYTPGKNHDGALHTSRRHPWPLAIAAVTSGIFTLDFVGLDRQASAMGMDRRVGVRNMLSGAAVGTVGYGALLLIGDAAQYSVDQLRRGLVRFRPGLPGWSAAILASAAVGAAAAVVSDTVILRQTFGIARRNAEKLNTLVFPGTRPPHVPERTGSPASAESWDDLGAQGRALISTGPRRRDIAVVTRLGAGEPITAREPIRVVIGLKEGRSLEKSVQLALAELDRTGAWNRRAIIVQTSSGTGWLSDWSTASVEFLLAGDSAIVTIQYSYLPSGISYVADRMPPIEVSGALIDAVLNERDRRRAAGSNSTAGSSAASPRIFVAGESLGAYGIADSFDNIDELLARVDGAVFSGTPRITRMITELTEAREDDSPERLPIIGGGRHVRFTTHEALLRHDFAGRAYEHEWEHPRVVFAQHASDPVAWWSPSLFVREPDWLREPGTRLSPAPDTAHYDVSPGIHWVPLVTGWQIGIDQLASLQVPGGHGHNYHEEMIYYWAAILAEVSPFNTGASSADESLADPAGYLTPELVQGIADFVRADHIDR